MCGLGAVCCMVCMRLGLGSGMLWTRLGAGCAYGAWQLGQMYRRCCRLWWMSPMSCQDGVCGGSGEGGVGDEDDGGEDGDVEYDDGGVIYDVRE
jgi:hypothetical protein